MSSPAGVRSSSSGGGAKRAVPRHQTSDPTRVYRELFFAGFPCLLPYKPEDVSRRPKAIFTRQFVHDFFQHYGSLSHFVYDEERGMGSVTFDSGEVAERCYLAVHLSLLPPPNPDGSGGYGTWEVDEPGEPTAVRQRRPGDLVLCMEFAQCCPFVNPRLLLCGESLTSAAVSGEKQVGPETLNAGQLTRYSLRTFPQVVEAYSPSTAEFVVASWEAQPAAASPATADGGDTAASNASASTTSAVVTRVGPEYPCADIDLPAVTDSLWRVLRPSHVKPVAGNQVRVLDMWWEYYNQYYVHKTEPAPERITDPLMRFAQRPSVLQEVLLLQKLSRERSSGDTAYATTQLRRFIHDDVFHSVCTYLSLKAQLRYDPSWASLVRDVYTTKVRLALQAYREEWVAQQTKPVQSQASTSTGDATAAVAEEEEAGLGALDDPELQAIQAAINRDADGELKDHGGDRAVLQAAESAWLQMSFMDAASNAITNVSFLRRVQRGEVDAEGNDIDPAAKKKKDDDDDGVELEVTPTEEERAYDTRRNEEALFVEVLQTLDGFAFTGSAASLLSVCENPKLFRYARGHIGYNEARQKRPSKLWAYLNALWVPLILIIGFAWFAGWLSKRLTGGGGGDGGVGVGRGGAASGAAAGAGGGGGEAPYTTEMMKDAIARAAEAARRAGGSFHIGVQNDL